MTSYQRRPTTRIYQHLTNARNLLLAVDNALRQAQQQAKDVDARTGQPDPSKRRTRRVK